MQCVNVPRSFAVGTTVYHRASHKMTLRLTGASGPRKTNHTVPGCLLEQFCTSTQYHQGDPWQLQASPPAFRRRRLFELSAAEAVHELEAPAAAQRSAFFEPLLMAAAQPPAPAAEPAAAAAPPPALPVAPEVAQAAAAEEERSREAKARAAYEEDEVRLEGDCVSMQLQRAVWQAQQCCRGAWFSVIRSIRYVVLWVVACYLRGHCSAMALAIRSFSVHQSVPSMPLLPPPFRLRCARCALCCATSPPLPWRSRAGARSLSRRPPRRT